MWPCLAWSFGSWFTPHDALSIWGSYHTTVNQDVHFILQHCDLLSCYISIPCFLKSVHTPEVVFLTVTCGLFLPLYWQGIWEPYSLGNLPNWMSGLKIESWEQNTSFLFCLASSFLVSEKVSLLPRCWPFRWKGLRWCSGHQGLGLGVWWHYGASISAVWPVVHVRGPVFMA